MIFNKNSFELSPGILLDKNYIIRKKEKKLCDN